MEGFPLTYEGGRNEWSGARTDGPDRGNSSRSFLGHQCCNILSVLARRNNLQYAEYALLSILNTLSTRTTKHARVYSGMQYTNYSQNLQSDILSKYTTRVEARTVVGRGEKRLLSGPGSELRLGREKEK